jgi:hypothetical protein
MVGNGDNRVSGAAVCLSAMARGGAIETRSSDDKRARICASAFSNSRKHADCIRSVTNIRSANTSCAKLEDERHRAMKRRTKKVSVTCIQIQVCHRSTDRKD